MTTIDLELLIKLRRIGPTVAARMRRLNPEPTLAQQLRGIRYKRTARDWYVITGAMSRGRFIRRFGREAWGRLPASAIWKDGRRKFVSLTAVEEQRARSDVD